jgi:hypothetical protein
MVYKMLDGVCQVFLHTAQACHSERSPLGRSEESNPSGALLNDASGVLICLGTVGLWAGLDPFAPLRVTGLGLVADSSFLQNFVSHPAGCIIEEL